MHISVSKLHKAPGEVLDLALQEPIVIEKQGRPTVVILAYSKYQSLFLKKHKWPDAFFQDFDIDFPTDKELRVDISAPREIIL